MRQNSRLRKLPKPSIFLHKDRWVCEYYEFDEFGVAKAKRKAFVRDLRREGKQGTPDEQKAAAKAFAAKTLKAQKEQYGFERREKEQKILTPTQLREAKAAFAIFDQIPNRKKSLVDAVVLYREHLKLAIDTPSLEHAVLSFIGRKETAGKSPGDHVGLKENSIKTLKRHLMHMLRYFQQERPAIKLGDIGSMDLKRYFSTITSSGRNRLNYVGSVSAFFNDAANPADPHRLLNVNPMDAARLDLRRDGKLPSKKKKGGRAVETPKILSLPEVKRCMKVAIDYQDQGILGFVVLGLFVGLRPSEIDEMYLIKDHWNEYVKLEHRIVRIDSIGRMQDRRVVDLSENAIAWLTYLKNHKLPLSFKKDKKDRNGAFASFRARAFLASEEEGNRLINLRNATRRQVAKSAEDRAFQDQANQRLSEYRDVLRHTFGTNYYYAHNFDMNATVRQMGNSSQVFIQHYRGIPNHPDDHVDYWKIMPADFGLE